MTTARGSWISRFRGLIGNGGGDDRSGSETARETFSEPAVPGVQARQRWQTYKNAFWNTTRYALIAGMFALLLTMVILLNEVMSFHNGIRQQLGEPYARGVVLMLDEMNRHPEAYPEERALPVAELAVELDGVRRALGELGRFAKIQPAPGLTPTPAAGQLVASQAAAGSASGTSAKGVVSFDDQSKTLQIRLDHLRDTLYNASPLLPSQPRSRI